jgi:hypothetical protein
MRRTFFFERANGTMPERHCQMYRHFDLPLFWASCAKNRASKSLTAIPCDVITGLVPVISMRKAQRSSDRDGRHKAGHDVRK